MTSTSLATAGFLAFGAGGIGGIWLFLKEVAYAGSHPGVQLAGELQIVGLVLVALAIGGIVTLTLVRRESQAHKG
jgi:hypothetical protein